MLSAYTKSNLNCKLKKRLYKKKLRRRAIWRLKNVCIWKKNVAACFKEFVRRWTCSMSNAVLQHVV